MFNTPLINPALEYPAEWFYMALRGGRLDKPETARLGSYGDAALAAYRAGLQGGAAAVRQTLLDYARQQPELGVLVGTLSQLLTPDELAKQPPIQWLLDGILPRGVLAEMHGAPSVGKSLLALHFAARVSPRGVVVYVAAEGGAGYPARMAAWSALHGEPFPRDVLVFPHAVNLLDAAAVGAFGTALLAVRPALVVIDTLARCIVGAEENSAREIGMVINHCTGLVNALKTTVLLVHHTRKQGGTERGSSALRGACDVMLDVERTGKLLTVRCAKMKDAVEFTPFDMTIVPAGDSVALLPADDAPASTPDLATLSVAQRKVLTLLAEAYAQDSASQSQLVRDLGIPKTTIERALAWLQTSQFVQRLEAGRSVRYQITDLGVAAMQAAAASAWG